MTRAAAARLDGAEDEPRVLIVDDAQSSRRALRAALTRYGYAVFDAATGEEALRVVARVHPDLVILEFVLPDLSAIEVTRRLRAWSNVPIVILSAHDDEQATVAALDAGAEDYVTKPFRTGELLARLRVAMRRRAWPAPGAVIRVGDLVVDVTHRRVTMGLRYIALTPVEYALLKTLALAAGRALAPRQLLREIWGPECAPDLNVLRVSVNKLRHKLEPDPARPSYILTDARVGYRLDAPPSLLGNPARINPRRRPVTPPDATHGRVRARRVPRPQGDATCHV